jgi:HSP20 family molecular chaperone IbpA
MDPNNPRAWMWSEALASLDRAERMHREIFRPARFSSQQSAWTPPVDVFETSDEVIILIALPCVDAEDVEISLDGGALIFSGTSTWPTTLGGAAIHRLELPQGRFERHVPLPPGRYSAARRSVARGCLTVVLRKLGASGG